MLKNRFLMALRNFRRAPLSSAVNVATLALGATCFVVAYAFVTFWERSEQHFANADRIALLTLDLTVPCLITLTDEPQKRKGACQ